MSKKRHKKDDSNKKKTFVEQMASDPKQAAESESSSRSNESSESSETLKKSPSSRPSLSDLITAQIDTHGDEQARRTLIVDAWESRNEIYHQMFGAPSHSDPHNWAPPPRQLPANYKPSERKTMSLDTSEPSLLADEQQLAILAYGPDPLRPFWTYVTAGLSTPWLQYGHQEVSGFGIELIVKSPTDAKWPAQLLRTMAFYVFNHAGVLSPGVRVSLNGPVDPYSNSELKHAVVWYADEAPEAWCMLPSGGFGLFNVLGITDDEMEFADSIKDYGTWCIQQAVKNIGHGQVTDPYRSSIMKHENINAVLGGVRTFADTFRANKENKFLADPDSIT
ncbi:suppressor of fused domain protein [bacterium]|nr:suppressor of fused domain protein [bacterium]